MCPTCQTIHKALLKKHPSHTIDLQPDIYPVMFRARFPESEVSFDYGLKVADHIEQFLYDVSGRPITVLAYSNFADSPTFESQVWVSILIEFPEDEEEVVRMFDALVGVLGGWEVGVPEGCPCAFWLEWHRDPMSL